MDVFFNDKTLPSTSQSTPKTGHEESHMSLASQTVEPDHDSSFGKFSTASMNDTQEHHISTSIDNISRKVQELVEATNDGRTRDQRAMDSFYEKLVGKVTEACRQMKGHMYKVYEENSTEMQMKLQELSEILDSCTKLFNELREANQALASLREGLAIAIKESSNE